MKHVVFDLGKVLLDWDPRYLFVDHLGLSRADAQRLLSEVCSPQWHVEFDRGRTFGDGVAQLVEAHPAHRDHIEQYAAQWPRMFAGVIDSTVSQLNRLHAAGIRIHALSNYPPQKIRFLYEAFDFMRLFDTVLISGLLRVVKPDPEIFHRLVDSIGTSDCVFIDDREENVRVAAELGMDVIHFTPQDGPQRVAALLASLE